MQSELERRNYRMNYTLKQGAAQSAEIGVLGVVDLDEAPWVHPATNKLTFNFDLVLGAHDGERKKSLQCKQDGKGVDKNDRIRLTLSSLLSAMVSSSSSSTSYGKLYTGIP